MKQLFLLMCLFFTSMVNSAAFVEGDDLPEMTLIDQFDQPLTVNANTRTLLFSRDMQGGKLIQAALEKMPRTDSSLSPVYYADIHSMPSLIAKFIAIPKIRDLSFAIGLDRAGHMTERLPSKDEQATLIRLNDFKITSIETFQELEGLLLALSRKP